MGPSLSTPLPSTAMPCWTPELDGFFITSVTLPAFAERDIGENISFPFGSALRLSVSPPAVEAGEGWLLVLVDGELALLLLPQPTIASATTGTARVEANKVVVLRVIGAPFGPV